MSCGTPRTSTPNKTCPDVMTCAVPGGPPSRQRRNLNTHGRQGTHRGTRSRSDARLAAGGGVFLVRGAAVGLGTERLGATGRRVVQGVAGGVLGEVEVERRPLGPDARHAVEVAQRRRAGRG